MESLASSSPRGGSNSPGGAGRLWDGVTKLGWGWGPGAHPTSARRALLPSDSHKEAFV